MKTHDELLADFVGKRLKPPSEGYDQQWEFPFCDGYYPTLKTMKFKTSWDWLMPVVQKIRSLLQNNELYEKAKDLWGFIVVTLETVEIAAVRISVIQFIQWYNENKKV